MDFAFQNITTGNEILDNFEKKNPFQGYFTFSEKNARYEHSEAYPNEPDLDFLNALWNGYRDGWIKSFGHVKISLSEQPEINYSSNFYQYCCKAIIDAGLCLPNKEGYYYISEPSKDEHIPFINKVFEKNNPPPEYVKYIPDWQHNYKAKNHEYYKVYSHEVSLYDTKWDGWLKGWKEAQKSIIVQIPSFDEVAKLSQKEILLKFKQALLDIGLS